MRTTSEYNAKNQLIRSTDGAGNATTYTYDGYGNQSQITDANGNISRYTYNKQNRLVKMMDALGGETHYSYDIDGNRTKVIAPNGAVTEYFYDNFNQLIREVSADRGTITYQYNAAGQQIAITTANGDTKRTRYDLLGRKARETWDHHPDLTVTYRYDECDNGIGKLCTVTDNTGSISYAYNEDGQIIKKSQSIDGVTPLLALGFCWAHKTGEWLNEQTPVKTKTHEHYAYSLFQYGLHYLADQLYRQVEEAKRLRGKS